MFFMVNRYMMRHRYPMLFQITSKFNTTLIYDTRIIHIKYILSTVIKNSRDFCSYLILSSVASVAPFQDDSGCTTILHRPPKIISTHKSCVTQGRCQLSLPVLRHTQWAAFPGSPGEEGHVQTLFPYFGQPKRTDVELS